MASSDGRVRGQARPILRRAIWEDDTGRKWVTLVPEGRECDATIGVPLGPPDTSSLGLPEHLDIALNHQLVARGLITRRDITGKNKELFAALQATYKVDVVRLMGCFRND